MGAFNKNKKHDGTSLIVKKGKIKPRASKDWLLKNIVHSQSIFH